MSKDQQLNGTVMDTVATSPAHAASTGQSPGSNPRFDLHNAIQPVQSGNSYPPNPYINPYGQPGKTSPVYAAYHAQSHRLPGQVNMSGSSPIGDFAQQPLQATQPYVQHYPSQQAPFQQINSPYSTYQYSQQYPQQQHQTFQSHHHHPQQIQQQYQNAYGPQAPQFHVQTARRPTQNEFGPGPPTAAPSTPEADATRPAMRVDSQHMHSQLPAQTSVSSLTSTSVIQAKAESPSGPRQQGNEAVGGAHDVASSLPYDPAALTWNFEKTLNREHRYCYCGDDRNLLDVDVQCSRCSNFFHGRCIKLDMGPVVPFMTNYHFACRNCSPTQSESFTRSVCPWKNICASVMANLVLMRMRMKNPTWDKSCYASKLLQQSMPEVGWFSRKSDIVPFLEVPRHWAAICTEKDKTEATSWPSTLGNALVSNPDLFKAHDEASRSANSAYSLSNLNLFAFRHGYLAGTKNSVPRKRKAEDTDNSTHRTASEPVPAPDFATQPEPIPTADSASIPPERTSSREKAVNKIEEAPTFTPKIPVKKESNRASTVVTKDLTRERKPTAKKATTTKKADAPPAKLIRRPPPYRPQDFGAVPKQPGMNPVEGHFEQGPYYSFTDIPYNKRGFKYSLCEAAPAMPAIMYRQVEVAPYEARMDWSDISPYMYLSKDAKSATTDKGFRMGRANVGMREGQWYWEVKVLRGNGEQGGHVRLGIARREASLDGPIGFDGYSYGIRDKGGEKMHLSRPRRFMDSFGTGDVIGFHLTLPPAPKTDVVRDKIPIRYRGQLYFEQFEYTTNKEMEDLLHPGTAPATRAPSPATLKHSSLKVYKNGKAMGTAFDHLLSFWPPHCQTTRDTPAPDDGLSGYYPAISVYARGAARFNFGPTFECVPERNLLSGGNNGARGGRVRPLSDRYDEQVAEDVVFDVLDEIAMEQDLRDLSLGEPQLEVEPMREIAEYD